MTALPGILGTMADGGELLQELKEIRVNWQLTVVICALVVLPIAVVGLASVIADADQVGARGVKLFCGTLIPVTLLLCALAIWSRLSRISDRAGRVKALKRLGLGVLIVAAAAGLSAISYFFGTFAALGYHFYYLPTGIYVVGLGMIGTAMVSTEATTVKHRKW
jgi:hypothetical protein